VIFVTVGSSAWPFPRLAVALEHLPAAELVVQHGPNDPPHGVAEATPYMSFAQLLDNIERADAVVSHAGAGSIICALRAGHTPVIVPRLSRFKETVDDHQADLARAFESAGKVIALWDVDRISEAVASVPPRRSADQLGELTELPVHVAVRAAVDGVL
jgi:UDP-N-acetylglucosamine transferase subunit ALG13